MVSRILNWALDHFGPLLGAAILLALLVVLIVGKK